MFSYLIAVLIGAVLGAGASYAVLRNNIRLLKLQLQSPVTTKANVAAAAKPALKS